ncbi:GntR family transcriptional regulator [Acuticoccus mangrovi]|uniref:GntR family transcriptional regulator n=1 Tax=Acuticoccus mangrovi TaxID=2796142 RepID=A0A934ITE1_9HYPH|nr:GntR family transcriptional regulator [Acuticoccus mangrovi]MBJ3777339.1 GntR family transcriptional regulator [Acuticoccus mangrovi]
MNKLDLQVERKSATLRGRVEEKLREAIASGLFKPGQRLIERELCEILGVGRTSVREALRQLEAEGLIESLPHRGPSVSNIRIEEAEQLYALRGLLEGYAGEQCAARADGAFLAKLDAAVEAFVAAAHSGEREALVATKTEFYNLLLNGCGNKFVAQTLTSLHNRINLLRFTSMTQPDRLKHSITEIQEIAATIRSGDVAAAGDACRRHIHNAAHVALDYMRSNATPSDREEA